VEDSSGEESMDEESLAEDGEQPLMVFHFIC
jgi:hypothetical protein